MTPHPSRRLLVDRPLALVFCFCAAYLVTWAGHLDSGDSSYRIAWAKSMLFHHTARIDDAGLGAQFCKYSIGHSILAMPFLLASETLKQVAHVRAEGPIYMLLFVLNAAVFMAMVAKYLRMRCSPVATGRTLLLLGFCTVWLPCSRMDSIEQLVLTFLFGGFLVAKQGRPILGMLLASLAIAIRPDAVIAVGLFGIWQIHNAGRWITAWRFAAACLPAIAINAAANWVRWGTFSEVGYSGETFSTPFLAGLHGILFSAGKSIFLYSPPLLLGIAGLIRASRSRASYIADYWFFAAVLASEVLLYSAWWDWSGDDCWGIRFLNPGVMLLCIPAVELLDRRRWPVPAVALALTGLFVQMLAVVIDPMASDYVIRHFELPRQHVFFTRSDKSPNRIDVDDLRFNPRYSPFATNWLMLRLLAKLPPAKQTNQLEIRRTGTPLYDSLLASGWNPDTVECDVFWVRFAKKGK